MEQALFDCIHMEKQAGYQMETVRLHDDQGYELEEEVAAFHYPYRVPTAHPIRSGDWVEYVERVSIEWR